MRKLVTHRTITDIKEHPNADAIELAIIDGWQVVTKKGEFQKGDSCCFFEIDSFLPADDDRFEFLRKSGIKKDESGQERIRLKTVKLRKELSQGLALPWYLFPEFHDLDDLEDIDMASLINVIKYERPEPKVTNASGYFPDILKKTDEDRIQNMYIRLKHNYLSDLFVPTLKLDGSSCTVTYLSEDHQHYWKNETPVDGNAIDVCSHAAGDKIAEVIVCSRNLQLKYDENSHFWKAAIESEVPTSLENWGRFHNKSLAIQGEVIGPGIQGNKEKVNNFQFWVFNIFDIETQSYWSWGSVKDFCQDHRLNLVPEVSEIASPFTDMTFEELLKHADGKSLNANKREGVVWKKVNDGNVSFKVISNKWLLAGGDE